MAVYTTIDNPELYFQTKLYTGNGSTQSLTLDGDTDMQPDLVWVKNRSEDYEHTLFDSVRGVQKFIRSSTNGSEQTNANTLTAFGTDGFSVGNDGSVNDNTDGFVAWCWKESNSDAGFDIVSYTGNGSTQNISHSLSAKPDFMLLKLTSGTGGWLVYHSSLGATKAIYLNETGAVGTNSSGFNDTEPTSSVFSLGSGAYANTSSGTQICYAWTSKQGFSKFGTYTGNGNVDGTFVYTGFRPAFLMIKQYDAAGTDWTILDSKRPAENPADQWLAPNTNAVEVANNTTALSADLLSNGFKLRGSASDGTNGSDDDFIYAAFAEAPFVNSKGVPCNAR